MGDVQGRKGKKRNILLHILCGKILAKPILYHSFLSPIKESADICLEKVWHSTQG